MQIQHFLTPNVEDRDGMEGRSAESAEGVSERSAKAGLSSSTVSESSDVMEGVDDDGRRWASRDEASLLLCSSSRLAEPLLSWGGCGVSDSMVVLVTSEEVETRVKVMAKCATSNIHLLATLALLPCRRL